MRRVGDVCCSGYSCIDRMCTVPLIPAGGVCQIACVREDQHVSTTDVLSLSSLPEEYANTEMFVRLDMSVSVAGAIQIAFNLAECVG